MRCGLSGPAGAEFVPDLMTHVVVAHGVRRTAELCRGRPWPVQAAALFYLGTCLPDYLGRAPGFVFWGYWTDRLIGCLHAPVVAVLVGYALALCLPVAQRRAGFALTVAGAGLHYLLDWLQTPLDFHGEDWFFPLAEGGGHLGLFWPDETYLALPWLLAALALLEAAFRLRTARKS